MSMSPIEKTWLCPCSNLVSFDVEASGFRSASFLLCPRIMGTLPFIYVLQVTKRVLCAICHMQCLKLMYTILTRTFWYSFPFNGCFPRMACAHLQCVLRDCDVPTDKRRKVSLPPI